MPSLEYNEPIPLLILSDDPSAPSGLARITRDLASRIHEYLSDVFEVATVGYGGAGSRRLKFKSYHLHSLENWLPHELPQIWNDFAGDREGILMPIWDLSRLWWINSPQAPAHIRQWLDTAKMKKWLYHPVDAEGPGGKMSIRLHETMVGFDRVLDYSAFSCRVTGNTDYLPHGIDTSVFHPYDKKESKATFREAGFMALQDDDFLVGIVATNQNRKDWALAVQTCRLLLDRGLDMKMWFHVDILERYWSLPNLIADYGLANRVVITNAVFTDEQMAKFYSACDVTLGVGSEGFGYPLAESLACGVPVVHMKYSGGSDFVPNRMQVHPVGYRYEGLYCCKRPVFNPEDWASKAMDLAGTSTKLPPQLDWNNLWPEWKSWLMRGIA